MTTSDASEILSTSGEAPSEHRCESATSTVVGCAKQIARRGRSAGRPEDDAMVQRPSGQMGAGTVEAELRGVETAAGVYWPMRSASDEACSEVQE